MVGYFSGEYGAGFVQGAGLQMADVAEQLATELINAGYDPLEVRDGIERAGPALAAEGVKRYRDEQALAEMRATVKQRFGWS